MSTVLSVPSPSDETAPVSDYVGEKYVLPVNNDELERLTTQHEILKKAFDGKILFVPIEGRPSYLVLDSGVGPAVWLRDAASHFSPSSVLHGIDISERLWPMASRPANMSFSVNSVTELPIEWSNRFDLVNQRLLVGALTKSDWPIALANILRVLRPGGYVQLFEAETRMKIGPAADKALGAFAALGHARNLDYHITENLQRLLSEAGFAEVCTERRETPVYGTEGTPWRKNAIGILRGVKEPVLQAGGFGIVETGEEFDELLIEAEKEMRNGQGGGWGLHVFTARKPF